MDFGLAITSTLEQEKTNLITKLSDELELAFKDKNYGNDVKSYTIGVNCVSIPKGFEKFSKLPKPSYTKGKKVINPDGIPFTLEDNFECSIKIDFETFKNGTEEECRKLLAREILNSLSIIESMKNKIKDFDLIKFHSDLETYFKKKGLV